MSTQVRKLNDRYIVTHNDEVRVAYDFLHLSQLLDTLLNRVYVDKTFPNDWIRFNLEKELKC